MTLSEKLKQLKELKEREELLAGIQVGDDVCVNIDNLPESLASWTWCEVTEIITGVPDLLFEVSWGYARIDINSSDGIRF